MRAGSRLLGTALVVAAMASGCVQARADFPAPVKDPVTECDPTSPGVDSGEAAPQGDLPGWHQVFVDDFDRCELGDNWGPYSGQPGGDPASWWDPSQVAVGNGMMRLRAQQKDGRWVTGGASNSPVSQQYGKWSIRLRADKSDEISYHILLWPQNEIWPPEIDIAESADGTRQSMSSFLHWADPAGVQHFSQADVSIDTNNWQTIGVEWTPDEITYLVNGTVWARTPRDAQIPDTPMWLGIQAQAGACTKLQEWGVGECGQAGTPEIADVDIDWVSVYTSDGTPSTTPNAQAVPTELTQRR